MNRFDSFLKSYLPFYLKYLDEGIINEIVICDETGDDYQKIIDTFGDIPNLRVFQNDSVLGVFKNKLKVASLASFDYVALIDSDNFADETYFKTARNYICDNGHLFSSHVILAPSFAKPDFNYKIFEGNIVTKANLKGVYYNSIFCTLLNTGNYIIHKNIINHIIYDESVMFYITSCDVLYFNLLVFLQFDDFQLHIVKNLEYYHILDNSSVYLNTYHNCYEFLHNVILPQYERLAS